MTVLSLCAVIFFTAAVLTASGQVSDVEMSALYDLFHSTNGDSWLWRNTSVIWNFTRDADGKFIDNPCSSEWEGLQCSESIPQKCLIVPCDITAVHLTSFNLTGTLPRTIGDLTALKVLGFEFNNLVGTIPSAIGKLTNMIVLSFHFNSLAGSIPDEIGNLIKLTSIDLESNYLTGQIPHSIVNLVQMNYLDLEDNALSGTIPPHMSNLATLHILNIRINMLTGSIPSDIGTMQFLLGIHLSFNLLSGTIPPEIGDLLRLNHLTFDGNALTGTIPSALGNLVNVATLNIEDSQLTGTIPPELGKLTSLLVLDLQTNALSGKIPAEFSNLVNIFAMTLHNNHLTGTIPTAINRLEKLETFFLQDNALIGRIDHLFNSSSQQSLSLIDLSNNQLSGSYLNQLFHLPALRVLALSVNCFQEKLSEIMCAAPKVEVLSLNGLGSAEGCGNTLKLPLSDVVLFNTIGGTLPECVWHLRNLNVLHLTGNGLTGELLATLPPNSSLTDISLSHNKLSGTIPDGIQTVHTIDLSFNQFSGKYEDNPHAWSNAVVDLEINRLSGQLRVSQLENVSDLRILRGNMFSCDTIPANDKNVHDYVCGSEDLNDSLYLFAATLLFLCCVVLVIFLAKASARFHLTKQFLVSSNFNAKITQLGFYISYVNNNQKQEGDDKWNLMQIAAFCNKFREIVRLFVQLSVVMLVVITPIYVVKSGDDGSYTTHTNTYGWYWTLAYMRGVVPSSLLMMSWIVMITVCFYWMILAPSIEATPAEDLPAPQSNSNSAKTSRAPNISMIKNYLWLLALLVANAAVTIVVNALYIYSTQQPLPEYINFGIQFSLAVFRLGYASFVFPILSRPIVDPIANICYRLRLLTVNNLIIPCFATAFTSPACFQGLIVPADEVSTPYTYRECMFVIPTLNGNFLCVVWNYIKVDSAAMVPTFTYNNQCSSVILTSYIPVLIIGFSLQLLLCFILPLLLSHCGKSVFSVQYLIRHKAIAGVLWPDYWSKNDNPDQVALNKAMVEKDPTVVINSKSILKVTLNGLMVMLSFGLCSPILAVAVTCSLTVQMYMWMLLVGRFSLKLRNNQDDDIHFALAGLAKVIFPVREVFAQSFWLMKHLDQLQCSEVRELRVSGHSGDRLFGQQ